MKRVAYIFSALCLLQLGAGLSADQPSQSVGVGATAKEPAEYNSTVVDTVYSDFPYLKRVYNWGSGKSKEPSVPFVELDTNTYEKKLWLSEKKLLTLPVKSKLGKVVGKDSIVYVVYSSRDTGYWHVNSTYSTNYGKDWSIPLTIQTTGWGDAGYPSPLILDTNIFVSYSASPPDQDFLEEILFRKTTVQSFVWSDSIVIDTTFSSSEALFRPSLVCRRDTLYICYGFNDYPTYTMSFKKSYDFGYTWLSLSMVTSASFPKSFLLTDTVLSLIYFWENTPLMPAVNICRSFNGGETWEPSVDLSDNGYASQRLAASSDGVSDIHVVWYDFDGAPPGWEGYVFYRRSLDRGDSWEDTKSLSTEPYSASVEIWGDTTYVYAVWNDGRDIGPPYQALYFRCSRDRGQTWSPEIKIVPETDPSWYPDIYADGDYFHLVWMEQDPPEYIQGVYYMFGVWYLPGDVDYSDGVNVADLTYFVDYLFFGGDEPFVPDAAEMNGEPGVNVADLTYLVDYLFFGGPPPVGGTTGF